MSVKYDEYLETHKENVLNAFKWLRDNLPENLFPSEIKEGVGLSLISHDASKSSIEEYDAYDRYFNSSRSYEVTENFQYAWLHHLHHNPHHWQYWVLINDDKDSGEKCLEIPDNYIIEMISDWWSFSWTNGNLYEIFDWYNNGKDYRKINELSLKKIETILSFIKDKLEKEKV